MSDPTDSCPFCKSTLDAARYGEALQRFTLATSQGATDDEVDQLQNEVSDLISKLKTNKWDYFLAALGDELDVQLLEDSLSPRIGQPVVRLGQFLQHAGAQGWEVCGTIPPTERRSALLILKTRG